MHTDSLDKKDYKYIIESPTHFSSERNKAVIDSVIKKTDEMIVRKRKEYREQLGERVDAITSYFQHMKSKNTPIDQYFGKRGLAHLRGETMLEKFNGNRISMDTSKLASSLLTKKN